VKRYLSTPAGVQLDRVRRQTRRHSRGWWEFHQASELARKSVHAVRSVAAVEDMAGLVERRSAVVFEEVAGDAVERVWPAALERRSPITRGASRHAATRRLARFISAFHQTGASHRDLYLCHVFVRLDETARRPPHFALLDLARVHYPRLRRTRWIIKDLAQVDCSARQCGATRTDRLRFLIAYLGLHADTPRVRWYARRIVRKSDHILRRIARKRGSA
jgi:heptose I phosphotransferase